MSCVRCGLWDAWIGQSFAGKIPWALTDLQKSPPLPPPLVIKILIGSMKKKNSNNYWNHIMSMQHSEPGNYFKPAEGNKDILPRESFRLTQADRALQPHNSPQGKMLETDRAPPPHSVIRSDSECCCSLFFSLTERELFISPAWAGGEQLISELPVKSKFRFCLTVVSVHLHPKTTEAVRANYLFKSLC